MLRISAYSVSGSIFGVGADINGTRGAAVFCGAVGILSRGGRTIVGAVGGCCVGWGAGVSGAVGVADTDSCTWDGFATGAGGGVVESCNGNVMRRNRGCNKI